MNAADKPEFRLTLPPGWTETAEINEGQPVRAFRPPANAPGVLRLLTDRIDGGADAASAAVKLRETAVRFLRPDDGRVHDRVVEDRPQGGLIATAAIVAEQEDGRVETHYLWLAAETRPDGRIDAAMAALAMPKELDGDPTAAETAAMVDAAMRAGRLFSMPPLSPVKANTVCCGSCSG